MTETLTHIGRYEIIERVGRGGMGVLYRGRDTVLDREVAIKVMSGDFSSDETAHNRFFREARAAAKLQHRNVVTIFEFAEHEDTPYIVMEFLRGRSLATRLRESAELPLLEKLDIMTQLCAGLDFAHREGVVHRDVKPGNIWLCTDGSVKLLDFGIAKSASSTITRFGNVMGSPSYMSPEQVVGHELDGRSDVFSAGVVLYELLSGRRPFEAETPTAVMMKIADDSPRPLSECAPGVPPALLATVARALEKDVDRRYGSAAEFASDLQLVRLEIEDGRDPEASAILDETLFADDLLSRDSMRGGATLTASIPAPPPAAPRRAPVPVVAGLMVSAVLLVGGVAWWNRADPTTAAPGGTLPPVLPLVSAPSPAPPTETEVPAPPPPAPPRPAALAIGSEPEGAAVSVDGRDTGLVTPTSVPLLDGRRPRRIRLTKKGFDSREAAVTQGMLDAGRATFRLEATDTRTVSVTIEGSYPFQVVDGGRVLSPAATDHRVSVSGRRTIRVRSAEFFLDQAFTVDPAAGRQTTFQVPAPGRLTIRTPLETCTVMVGGRSLGFPPISSVPIAAGTHTVQLKCQSASPKPVSVVVAPGQSAVEIIR